MGDDQKQQLQEYLTVTREAVSWKAEGLWEYDVRGPLTRTGTNLLGLIKHLSIVEAWYFGKTFNRPFEPHLPWWDDDAPEGGDMWATASRSRHEILETYQAAIAHADATSGRSTSTLPDTCPGGRDQTSRCTRYWSTSSRRRHATPDTATSCASNSTGVPGCEQAI